MSLPEPNIRRYERFLRERHGLRFADYEALWRWSVADLPAFWQSVWDYFVGPAKFTQLRLG